MAANPNAHADCRAGRAAVAAVAVAAVIAVLPALVSTATAQPAPAVSPLPDYTGGAGFLPTTPGVTGGAPGAPFNPAAWGTGDRSETAFWWDDRSVEEGALDNFGFSHGRRLGIAYWRRTALLEGRSRHLDSWQLGATVGNRASVIGVAYRWASGGTENFPQEDAIVLGSIARPSRAVSFGLAHHRSVESGAWLGIADLGIRPLGRDWLTVFGDYALRDGNDLGSGLWGAGVEVKPLRGLQLGARLREDALGGDPELTVHAGVTVSGLGLHALPSWNGDGDLARTSYLVRTGASYRSLPVALPDLRPDRPRYVPLSLENRRLTYQKYRWFDRERVAWLDLATELDRIRDSADADGVALNLAGVSLRPSLAWELRRKLQELRGAGKEVLVQVDRVGGLEYWAASAANRVTMDPEGTILLPGMVMKRTYLRDMLDKLGVGVQELRYFTYKSAMEGYARTGMSDADREQRGRLVDVVYERIRDDVAEARAFAPARFDSIVDHDVLLTSSLARERGLVDDLARWHELPEWLERERDGARLAGLPERDRRRWHEERWGEPPRIAVVYAVGSTSMEGGIGGRATSAHLRDLAKRPDVAAVVLRADSPGGDVLPGDLVAEAIALVRKEGKPVVVSQGDVAASGGYWISMRGSRILTTPMTVTGSIGVIGGWFWDAGLGEKLGLDTDGVWRGAHADLFGQLSFPLLGAGLPTRPLSEEELVLIRSRILDMYDRFVLAVAESRNLPEARVREIAEGRVWMGGDALRLGLVDELGGLSEAIALARADAGLAPEDEIVIEEYPARKLLQLPSLLPRVPRPISWLAGVPLVGGLVGELPAADEAPMALGAPGAEPAALDAVQDYLRSALRSPGAPLLLLHPDELPEAWRAADRAAPAP